MNKSITVIIVSLLLFGCENSQIKFTEPQPNFRKSLTEFPAKFQGNYISKKDSLIILTLDWSLDLNDDDFQLKRVENKIQITKNSIINLISGVLAIDFKEMEKSDVDYSNDLFFEEEVLGIFLRPNYSYSIEIKKDSIKDFTFNIQDTLFHFSSTNIAKKYKQKIYLNIKSENET